MSNRRQIRAYVWKCLAFLAALVFGALAPLALDIFGVVDQSVTVRTVVGVAADFLRVVRFGWRPSLMLALRYIFKLYYGLSTHRLNVSFDRVKKVWLCADDETVTSTFKMTGTLYMI